MSLFVKVIMKLGLFAGIGTDLVELGLNYGIICKTCLLLLYIPWYRHYLLGLNYELTIGF